MQPPMIGSWSVRVDAVRPFTIHGDLYYDLQAVRTNDPQGQAFSLKIPQHATAGEPTPGQVLLVKFLMGQVTEAKPVQGQS
ncbi:MAG TPA: hypothetical protein VN541_19750 [Tepidisphaeraceae bacterium]|nr:hypothetical protein [Tepidisphaeraceae bacterium]